MGRMGDTVSELHKLDMEAVKCGWLQRMHPLPKLLVTIFFLVLTVSFGKYDLQGLIKMGIYLIVLFVLGDISVKRLFKRMKAVLALVCLMGAANPFFDRETAALLGPVVITGGMVSAAVLIVKGIFAVSAAYLLIAVTPVSDVCYALRRLHVPKIFVTVIMLIYRYVIVLLKEAERMTDAYMLRAPEQNGIEYRVWGTFAGQLLLRSMDRAQTVYDSMMLRGYDGEFYLREKRPAGCTDYLYLFIWSMVLAAIRIM